MQPGEETSTIATAREAAGATLTNGAHHEGGAGETSDMAATGEEESKGTRDELGASGGGGGNRWPRQETVALLKIRSDMDALFRDSSHKGPLWEQVSRSMAELGYRRSAKKCKEKFENVLKYHKRTKEGRGSKSDGKTYRFFDQLEAFEANTPSSGHPSLPVEAAVPLSMAMPPPRPPPPPPTTTIITTQPQVIVPSATLQQLSNIQPPIHHIPPQSQSPQNANPFNFPGSPSGTPTSSSSTSSDEEVMGKRSKRKRKWKDFFEQLTKDVMKRQEELQTKFLEAIEKRENERRVREEAWKAQELVRLRREHDILVQERSTAAAKDAALISFLQKLSEKQQISLPLGIIQSQLPPSPTIPAPVPVSVPISQTQLMPATNAALQPRVLEPIRTSNGDPKASSSRWPKAEVEALIKLKTSLEHKYEESGPKGPLWEEISSAMRKLGYDRNAKRCKEKWENINKYYKRMKESNKKRREDSKTCPYYHQLDALYKEKNGFGAKTHQPAAVAPVDAEEAEAAATIRAEPEKQWPQQDQDPGSDNMDQDDEEEEDDDEEDDDEGGGFEIVANNSNASAMGGATAAMENS